MKTSINISNEQKVIFRIDNQSRIKRIGIKSRTFDEKFNCYVQSFVIAKKLGKKIIVSELAFAQEETTEGIKLAGVWNIVRTEGLNIFCEKANA